MPLFISGTMAMMQFLLQNWALLAVFLAVAAAFWLARVSVTDSELPYTKSNSVLSADDLKFYKAIQAAAGGSWTVLMHIPLREVLQVPKHTPGAAYWRQKLDSHILDFALCHNDSLSLILAVELSNAGNAEQSRLFPQEALQAAGVPFMRVSLADQYDKIELRKLIDSCLSGKKK